MTMIKSKQESCFTALLVLALACSGTWLGLVQADEEIEETMTMKLTEVVELLQPFGQSCKTVPEKVHVEELVRNKEEASHESKCFRRCMLLQFDVMPEGKLEYDGTKTVEMMNMMFPDKEEHSRTITNKCNQANGLTDECEIAHSIAMCMLREMRTADYKIPEVEE